MTPSHRIQSQNSQNQPTHLAGTGPSPKSRPLIVGLTVLGALGGAAAGVLALRALADTIAPSDRPDRRSYQSYGFSGARRGIDLQDLARNVRGALTHAESVIRSIESVLIQAQGAAQGVSRAAEQFGPLLRPNHPEPNQQGHTPQESTHPRDIAASDKRDVSASDS